MQLICLAKNIKNAFFVRLQPSDQLLLLVELIILLALSQLIYMIKSHNDLIYF